MPMIAKRRGTFRRLHDAGFFAIPNAWDAGSAVRLAKLGFRAIASTSAGAAWTTGKDDGELSRDEVLAHLRRLVAATDLPVNADFENGFADAPDAVAVNVTLAVATGVAGVSVEDWSGTAIYDLGLAVERIAASRAAIDAVAPETMLIGRHERFRIPDMRIADSIARAVAYAGAGADCLFVPGMSDLGAVAELVAAVAPKPVNVLVGDFGATFGDLARLGVRRCSVGGSLANRTWQAFDAAAAELKAFEP